MGKNAKIHKRNRKARPKILKLYKGKCFYCGLPLTKKTATVDHFIPLSKNGSIEIENLRPACKRCNELKGDTVFSECRLIGKPLALGARE